MKKESGNLSFVPFSFYLSCPFKIGYFNLGVFLLPLTKTELRSFGWRRDHIWKPQAFQSLRELLFYFPILFFFYILVSRPSGVATVLGERTRSGWPVRPFRVCRDDMNASRSRSDLWMQQPPQLDYCRKHLPPAAGFLPIPPNTERKVGGLRSGGARCSEEPKYGLTNAHYVTATLFKTMLQKC